MRFLIQIWIICGLFLTSTIFGEQPGSKTTDTGFIQLTIKELRKFTGRYRSENGDFMRIKRVKDKLFVYNFVGEKWELKAVSATKFRLVNSSPVNYLQFEIIKGKVKGYKSFDFKRNKELKFVKISHFAFYKRYYWLLLLAITILIVFAIMRKKGLTNGVEDCVDCDTGRPFRYYK